MKIISVLMTMFSCVSIFSCRTTSARSHSFTKAEISDCDPKGVFETLRPGGLFARDRVVYNQPHLIQGVIHPQMEEKDATGSLGLYHVFEPKGSVENVVQSMNDIATLSLNAPTSPVRIASPQALFFEGLGKTLNVFSIEASKLLKAKSLKIDVPAESSTIIIVRGQTPSLVGAKLEGVVNPEKLLFVAPEAVSFTVRGDKFSGTVIAPKATINLDARLEGSLFGANVRSMVVTKPVMYRGCMFARDQFQK